MAVSGLLCLANCASVANLQTAETLSQGEISNTIAMGYGEVDLDTDSTTEAVAGTATIDYMLRYGLTDVDELGVRLTNFGAYISTDYKRKLYDDGSIKLAAGLALGGTKVTVTTNAGEASTTFFDIAVPLYADYWLDETKALFVSPKYMLSMISGTGTSDTYHRLGGSTGFRWGKTQGMIAEVGYLANLSEDNSDLWQFLVGGFF